MLLAEIALSPVGLSAAFAAGMISFLSPCVWPLVPAYLSYVSGVSFQISATRRAASPSPPWHSCSASARSSRRFGRARGRRRCAHGAPADARDRSGSDRADGRSAGRLGGMLFQQERRGCGSARRPAGPVGAVDRGCRVRHRLDAVRRADARVHPGAGGQTPGSVSTAVLLAVYSLGLGVPFLLSGLLFTRGLASFASLRRHTPLLVRGSGVILMGSAPCSRSGR